MRSRIPVEEINDLYQDMDLPGSEPLSPMEVVDALDAARYLLRMALPEIPEDDRMDDTIHLMISDLCDISDRMYACAYEEDRE